MRSPIRLAATLALTGALIAACSSGASSTPAPTAPPTAAPTVGPASATPAPTPAATPNACAPENLKLVSAGKMTVGTDNPAYSPYYLPKDGGNTPPWNTPYSGDPTTGTGFESAVAYAVAKQLGFGADAVTWIPVKFDNSYAPGPKKFDFDINQVSYTPQRAQAVDMSDGYYNVNQAVVSIKGSALSTVTSIAALKAFKFGAQAGTTSYNTIVSAIAPTAQPMVYDSNDAAINALKNKQIDGIVVDLPTAFYMTAAQLDNGVIVGQFAAPTGTDQEHFSLVLAKGSPLTSCVNQAIASLKADGTLDQLTKTWLSDKASAPVFQP